MHPSAIVFSLRSQLLKELQAAVLSVIDSSPDNLTLHIHELIQFVDEHSALLTPIANPNNDPAIRMKQLNDSLFPSAFDLVMNIASNHHRMIECKDFNNDRSVQIHEFNNRILTVIDCLGLFRNINEFFPELLWITELNNEMYNHFQSVIPMLMIHESYCSTFKIKIFEQLHAILFHERFAPVNETFEQLVIDNKAQLKPHQESSVANALVNVIQDYIQLRSQIDFTQELASQMESNWKNVRLIFFGIALFLKQLDKLEEHRIINLMIAFIDITIEHVREKYFHITQWSEIHSLKQMKILFRDPLDFIKVSNYYLLRKHQTNELHGGMVERVYQRQNARPYNPDDRPFTPPPEPELDFSQFFPHEYLTLKDHEISNLKEIPVTLESLKQFSDKAIAAFDFEQIVAMFDPLHQIDGTLSLSDFDTIIRLCESLLFCNSSFTLMLDLIQKFNEYADEMCYLNFGLSPNRFFELIKRNRLILLHCFNINVLPKTFALAHYMFNISKLYTVYFEPEFRPILSDSVLWTKFHSIEQEYIDKLVRCTDFEDSDFLEWRAKGVAHYGLEYFIHSGTIEDVVTYIAVNNVDLKAEIKPSLFDTYYTEEDECYPKTFIQLAMFYGDITKYKYILSCAYDYKVPFTMRPIYHRSLSLSNRFYRNPGNYERGFALDMFCLVHGNCPEMFHFIEDNNPALKYMFNFTANVVEGNKFIQELITNWELEIEFPAELHESDRLGLVIAKKILHEMNEAIGHLTFAEQVEQEKQRVLAAHPNSYVGGNMCDITVKANNLNIMKRIASNDEYKTPFRVLSRMIMCNQTEHAYTKYRIEFARTINMLNGFPGNYDCYTIGAVILDIITPHVEHFWRISNNIRDAMTLASMFYTRDIRQYMNDNKVPFMNQTFDRHAPLWCNDYEWILPGLTVDMILKMFTNKRQKLQLFRCSLGYQFLITLFTGFTHNRATVLNDMATEYARLEPLLTEFIDDMVKVAYTFIKSLK